MRILFCDDDPTILTQLKNYVFEYFQKHGGVHPEYAIYQSGDELLARNETADIAFLDVEMPGQSGIYVGAKLKEANPHIKIFIVTAYNDYLDEAMRFQVFRYLSKPIDRNRLFRNLKDALYQLNLSYQKIPVETPEGVIVLYADQIIWLEVEGRKVLLHTAKETLRTILDIHQWQEKLTLPCFYSPYRGIIINMHYVSEFSKDTIILRYNEKEQRIYLARRRYADFKDTYLLYMEAMK